MVTDEKQNQSASAFFTEFLKAAQSSWHPFFSTNSNKSKSANSNDEAQKQISEMLEQAWKKNIDAWQAIFGGNLKPENNVSKTPGAKVMPELSGKLMRLALNGMTHIQEQWTERLQKLKTLDEKAENFSNLDEMMYQRWNDWYEKEIHQFFNIPQIGMTRFYQENLNQVFDKYHQFQGALAEFSHFLYLPVKKSLKELQNELKKLSDSESYPEDNKIFYDKWIKTLENHYLNMFQSTEYMKALSKIVDALNDYMYARGTVLEDLFKTFPIPTNSDIDDLSKEIYELKRRIRSLEKKHKNKVPTAK
ncbi:MAG: hypothetical protein GY874_15550 [Desulfobacteraceae bacterium]|nr:hypothetical protein [Desulfobacteraceae bacterium]